MVRTHSLLLVSIKTDALSANKILFYGGCRVCVPTYYYLSMFIQTGK